MLVTPVGTSAAKVGAASEAIKTKEAVPIAQHLLKIRNPNFEIRSVILLKKSINASTKVSMNGKSPHWLLSTTNQVLISRLVHSYLTPETQNSENHPRCPYFLSEFLLTKSGKAAYWTLVQYRNTTAELNDFTAHIFVCILLLHRYGDSLRVGSDKESSNPVEAWRCVRACAVGNLRTRAALSPKTFNAVNRRSAITVLEKRAAVS
jgi:hypothetical protein